VASTATEQGGKDLDYSVSSSLFGWSDR